MNFSSKILLFLIKYSKVFQIFRQKHDFLSIFDKNLKFLKSLKKFRFFEFSSFWGVLALFVINSKKGQNRQKFSKNFSDLFSNETK